MHDPGSPSRQRPNPSDTESNQTDPSSNHHRPAKRPNRGKSQEREPPPSSISTDEEDVSLVDPAPTTTTTHPLSSDQPNQDASPDREVIVISSGDEDESDSDGSSSSSDEGDDVETRRITESKYHNLWRTKELQASRREIIQWAWQARRLKCQKCKSHEECVSPLVAGTGFRCLPCTKRHWKGKGCGLGKRLLHQRNVAKYDEVRRSGVGPKEAVERVFFAPKKPRGVSTGASTSGGHIDANTPSGSCSKSAATGTSSSNGNSHGNHSSANSTPLRSTPTTRSMTTSVYTPRGEALRPVVLIPRPGSASASSSRSAACSPRQTPRSAITTASRPNLSSPLRRSSPLVTSSSPSTSHHLDSPLQSTTTSHLYDEQGTTNTGLGTTPNTISTSTDTPPSSLHLPPSHPAPLTSPACRDATHHTALSALHLLDTELHNAQTFLSGATSKEEWMTVCGMIVLRLAQERKVTFKFPPQSGA